MALGSDALGARGGDGRDGPEVVSIASTPVIGGWTQRGAYVGSGTTVLPTFGGWKVVRRGRTVEIPLDASRHEPNEVAISPDGRWLLLSDARSRVTRHDLDGEDPAHGATLLSLEGTPTVVAWTPSGEPLVTESFGSFRGTRTPEAPRSDRIWVVERDGPRELFRSKLVWARGARGCPSCAGAACGNSPSLALSTDLGLAVLRPGGEVVWVTRAFRWDDVVDFEVSAGGDRLVFIARPRQGGTTGGTYVARLDRRTKPGNEADESLVELLDPRTDFHTLWVSADGRVATWANATGVWVRDLDRGPEAKVELGAVVAGKSFEVKGCSWDESQRRLAIAAGPHLFVAEVSRGRLPGPPVLARTFATKERSCFTAEPTWRDGGLLVTIVQDTSRESRRAPIRKKP